MLVGVSLSPPLGRRGGAAYIRIRVAQYHPGAERDAHAYLCLSEQLP